MRILEYSVAGNQTGTSGNIDSTISQSAFATLALLPALLLAGFPALADERAEAISAFEQVWEVFSHPRCANCHAAGDRPTQGEDGRPHSMSVVRGEKGQGTPGLKCSGCHFDTSLKVAPAPPTTSVAMILALI